MPWLDLGLSIHQHRRRPPPLTPLELLLRQSTTHERVSNLTVLDLVCTTSGWVFILSLSLLPSTQQISRKCCSTRKRAIVSWQIVIWQAYPNLRLIAEAGSGYIFGALFSM